MNKHLQNLSTLNSIPLVPIYQIFIRVGYAEYDFMTYSDVKKGDLFFYGDKTIRTLYQTGDFSENTEYPEGPNSVLLDYIRIYDLDKSKKEGKEKTKDIPVYLQVWPMYFYGEYV